MEVSGRFDYGAPPAVVYRLFTDKDALMSAIPSLQHLDEVELDLTRFGGHPNIWGEDRKGMEGYVTWASSGVQN